MKRGDLPSFARQKLDQIDADEARAACDERCLFHESAAPAEGVPFDAAHDNRDLETQPTMLRCVV
jgi:hypothetical protein